MADWQGWLYAAAVLIPLFAFALQIFGARVLKTWNAYLATGAIASSLVLSLVGFVAYFVASGGMPAPDHEHHEAAATEPLEIDPIGEEVHGNGANADNLETLDKRPIIPRTCFSIEPGIYLRDFGVRSEIDCYVSPTGAEPTGRVQNAMVTIDV